MFWPEASAYVVLAVNMLGDNGGSLRRDREDDDDEDDDEDDDDSDGGSVEHMGSRGGRSVSVTNKVKGGSLRSESVAPNRTNLLRKAPPSPLSRRTPQRLFGTPLPSRASLSSESIHQLGGVRSELKAFASLGPDARSVSSHRLVA